MTTPEQPTTKIELMSLQREGREHWEALLARVPLKRIAEAGVKSRRSVKDIVAHIAAWERHATERLSSLARGMPLEPLPPPNMTWEQYEHAFNARVDEVWRARSWSDVREEAATAYAEFIAAAEALPEEVLFGRDQPAWKIVAYNGYLHYADFVDHIGAWLHRKTSRPN